MVVDGPFSRLRDQTKETIVKGPYRLRSLAANHIVDAFNKLSTGLGEMPSSMAAGCLLSEV